MNRGVIAYVLIALLGLQSLVLGSMTAHAAGLTATAEHCEGSAGASGNALPSPHAEINDSAADVDCCGDHDSTVSNCAGHCVAASAGLVATAPQIEVERVSIRPTSLHSQLVSRYDAPPTPPPIA